MCLLISGRYCLTNIAESKMPILMRVAIHIKNISIKVVPIYFCSVSFNNNALHCYCNNLMGATHDRI